MNDRKPDPRIDAEAAALAAQRSPATLRYWEHRGWISGQGRRPRTYAIAEVLDTAALLDDGLTPEVRYETRYRGRNA